jgi:AmmeMemoRadiSam system protein A
VSRLGPTSRSRLIALARTSVRAAVLGGDPPVLPACAENDELAQPAGCFVTLKTAGELRGCLGHFEADAPVAERVREMAAASALEDPRFFAHRLRPEDLDGLEIEISVLSPRVKVDDPLSIQVGRDGIYVRKGRRSGCYLPQVATELGWTAEEFLSSCCADKARLAADAWRDSDTEVFRFEAEVFGS